MNNGFPGARFRFPFRVHFPLGSRGGVSELMKLAPEEKAPWGPPCLSLGARPEVRGTGPGSCWPTEQRLFQGLLKSNHLCLTFTSERRKGRAVTEKVQSDLEKKLGRARNSNCPMSDSMRRRCFCFGLFLRVCQRAGRGLGEQGSSTQDRRPLFQSPLPRAGGKCQSIGVRLQMLPTSNMKNLERMTCCPLPLCWPGCWKDVPSFLLFPR